MTIILDAATIAPADRAEAIRETIWNSVVRVQIEHHAEPEQIVARGEITRLGRLTISSMRSNATAVQRTPRLAKDDMPPSVFLALQLSGSSIVIQGRREAVLRPGDLALYDSTVPYTLLNGTGIHHHCFRIPVADLALPPSVISEVTALRLSPDRPVADLAATYFGPTAPRAFTHGSYKKQLKNPEVTEYVEIEGRGHSLILDHGWPDVANPALTLIKRFL